MATDSITILKSAGPLLTKVFDGDKVIPYDSAKHFSIETCPVSNLTQLSSLLRMLSTKGRRCAIRGVFIGDSAAQAIAPPEKPGMYPRLNQLFEEVPHHWAMFDIDHYNCLLFDPALEPEEAIREFILDRLPPEFHTVSFHWQLSSSAGRVAGTLRCHIWFWLSTAYTGPQLKNWVRANELPIDVAPLRKVQVHYVANPVFTNGAVDPVTQRMGLYRGEQDEVDLIIPDNLLANVDDSTHDTGDLELVDPTQKAGLIGAFCRAYPISRVINELLTEEFIFAIGSDRRVTWLNSGGGAPEGCFITDDDWYLGNTHNTDPFDGRLANAWDLVRQFKFGQLDADLTADERAMCAINELPSHRAMKAWADSLAEIKSQVTTAAESQRTLWVAAIRECETETVLRNEILPAAMAERASFTKADLDMLVSAVQAKMRALTGVRVPISAARGLVREASSVGHELVDRTEAPFWAQPFVYVTNGDVFLNTQTKERQTKQGFDFSFNRYMHPFIDENGIIPTPSFMASSTWQLECVANVAYNPTLPRIFEMSGQMYANTYSDANIPSTPPILTDREEEAWALVLGHIRMLLPDAREADLFLSWVAHNVQFPGRKIRWSPFMYGTPGAGKSYFQQLLEATMGPDNVSPLDAETLIKSSFNEWANRTAVIVLEEVRVPEHSARETDNKLKPVITNSTINIHPKGAKPYAVINVTNYMLFSNFADGLPLTDEDRRYMALHAAPGKEAARALSESGYFERLFAATESCAGALRKKLLEYPLSAEFNPNGHAPWTSAKGDVIELCKSDTHNALEDLIKDGGHGVTPEVISTAHLTEAIKNKTGAPVYTRSLQKLLTSAGFVFFDRVKWEGQAQRAWVSEAFLQTLPTDRADAKKKIREALDASDFQEEFLR